MCLLPPYVLVPNPSQRSVSKTSRIQPVGKYGIEAAHPDIFIEQQIDLHEGVVVATAKYHREALRRPPKAVDDFGRGLDISPRLWCCRRVRMQSNAHSLALCASVLNTSGATRSG